MAVKRTAHAGSSLDSPAAPPWIGRGCSPWGNPGVPRHATGPRLRAGERQSQVERKEAQSLPISKRMTRMSKMRPTPPLGP
jgi:hypothetical protein